MTAFWVAISGGLGSLCRYWTGIAAQRFLGSRLPWGTLAVNLLGSLAIGFTFAFFAARGELGSRTRIAITTGFLGGFTTYSAFAYESLQLLEKRNALAFFSYIGATSVLAISGCALGIALGRAVAR